jgi:hypothetical protein
MAAQLEGMAEKLLDDPQIRNAAEAMQERVMSDPEARRLLEELMRRLQPPQQNS